MKRFLCFLLVISLLVCCIPITAMAQSNEEITILFTHDTHDYLYPTTTFEDGRLIEHGGAARLKTLLKQYTDDKTIYVDGGDFSMGTLYQSAYTTDAYELRNLGLSGCAVTTLGNHEFDYGISGLTQMLRSAMSSGDALPQIVQSNIDFSGELTEEQQELKSVMEDYGVKEYTTLMCGGYKIGIFGLAGIDSIEYTQADVKFTDYIESAKKTVASLKKEGCDVIIALSHSGTEDDGAIGEDIDLAKSVDGIDLIVSAHSHTVYEKPVKIGDTVLVSSGEYLKCLGKISFTMKSGKLEVNDYRVIPIDSSVEEDPETAARIESYKQDINENYLSKEGVKFDDVICHSNFNLISLTEMYDTHQEYTMGNIIADSYLYEARRNGIDDIDVALVGLGTIRSSIKEGDITVADAFEICSLGVGADGSTGHPIITSYITGKELKLLTELDASLGSMVNPIKMSYSGLEYTFNTKRILLDRVTSVHLVRSDGTIEEIEDKKLYKVACNMYAANMLGMLNGLTKGILSITPKYADGTTIEDLYSVTLRDKSGNEIKEWVALKNYLMSFDKGASGVPELPEYYKNPLGRKVKTAIGGWARISHPGTACKIVPTVITVLFLLIVLIIFLIVRRRKKKKRRKAALKEEKDNEQKEKTEETQEKNEPKSDEDKGENNNI